MITLSLPDDLEAWVRIEVANGRSESLDKLVTDAVASRRRELDRLRAALDEGRAGAGIPLDSFLEELDGWIAQGETSPN